MKVIKCRKCGVIYERNKVLNDIEDNLFVCDECGNIDYLMDISYKDSISSSLSNLFPHEFIIDNIKCLSMESFIQSLRIKEKEVQEEVCSKYTGYMACKLKAAFPDWRETGYVYWQGKQISRISTEYSDLITKGYDCLFENIVFRYCLNSFKNRYLIHSIGCDEITETLLTESEYIYQLNRLIKKL